MPLPNVMNSLEVALQANAASYRRAVQASAPGDCWDFVILTAANEKQARGYRRELALQERVIGPAGAFFPAIQRTLVVPDPPGRRAGSGGATLAALRALTGEFGLDTSDLKRLRILLIHSGGAGQRLPAYSPVGKIFAPLPLLRPDGHIATLFDHLYVTLAGLPERLGPGMLVLAGDVFLLFDHRHVATPPAGVTAISMRVDAELGRGHGVFVVGKAGQITQTLQKVSVQAMRDAGAADSSGRVLIDTGLLFFDAPRTALMAELAGCASLRHRAGKGLHERFGGQIDLYADMTGALATRTRRAEFLRAPEFAAMRRELWSKLRGVRFGMSQVDGQFLHLGTTRQFRDAMVGRNPSPAAELFQRNVLAQSSWEMPPGRRVYHSVLRADARGNGGTLGEGSVIEHSILRGGCRIGAGSVVSQVVADAKPFELPDELLLFQAPIRSDADGTVRFVQVVCGVEDDFKGLHATGNCIYLNRPIGQWLARWGIRPHEIWPDTPLEKRTLWTARLFMATARREMAHAALALAGARPGRAALGAWRKSPRYSMAMVLEHSDPQSLIAHREIVSAALQTEELIAAIRSGQDRPLESVIGRYTTEGAYAEAEGLLTGAARSCADNAAAVLCQAREFWCAAQLLGRPDHPDPASARPRIAPLMRRAFAKVAEASETGQRQISFGRSGSAKLKPGMQITATAPVRLDLAGGWSDTPPYCFDRGGHVVNVAIDLDDRPPVQAVVRTLAEPRLILESRDLGQKLEITRAPFRAGELDPNDPFALHCAALDLAGLLPVGAGDMKRRMRELGAGLHIVTESRVPKGSGLGTSSILAAVLLAALHRLRDRTIPIPALIEQTLVLEQRLSTGGGWQDQVGGIIGGIKSTRTEAGIPQRPIIEQLALRSAQYQGLEERLVVYYSGQQRLARDILRRVMGRWLAREPAMQLLTDSLKEGAAALRGALLKGRWTAAAGQIAQYWQIKKELYPGSTTPAIDLLFLEMRPHYLAAGLAGAGGGGFAYFLCKDSAQASRLRLRLFDYSGRPGSPGNVYATRINREGLHIRTSQMG